MTLPGLTALDSSLLVGVSFIDSEHADLAMLLAQLSELASPSPKSAEFSELLSRLLDQLTHHFDNEEAYFKTCGLPADEVAQHLQAHCNILDEYTNLCFDLMRASTPPMAEISNMVKAWILDHLLEHDVKIRPYVAASAREALLPPGKPLH